MIAVLLALSAKSAVVSAIALGITAMLRGRAAADRADVLRAAVVVLLILPVVALFGPDLALRVLQPAPVLQSLQPAVIEAPLPLPANDLSAQVVLPPLWTWAVGVWSLGALLILGRFGLGLATLARWSRQGARVDQPDWLSALRRLSPNRRPKLRVSPAVPAPLSWGLSPGRILIGPEQLDRADQASAVLAHELAHIRRGDWLFLALSKAAVALFWFNPLVWIVARELERLSELAVDEAVVRSVDRETYARTLVGLAARITSPQPAHGAAAGMTGPARSLAERIKTVMSDKRPAPSRPWLIAASIAALAAVATPIAALELVNRAREDGAAMPVAIASAAVAASTAAEASADTAGLPAIDHDRSVHVVSNNGHSTRYVINDGEGYVELADGTRRPMTDEERREVDEARAAAREASQHAREAAAEARVQAREAHEHARAMAVDARRIAEQARAEARVHAQTAERYRSVDRAAIREQVAQARAAADEARAMARIHQVDGERIRQQVAREMVNVRREMAAGADGMERGAREMREEANRLRDPAYRARQIAEQRERGQTVTDQELLDAIPKMLEGADRMEEGAARMRDSSRGRD